MSGPQVSFNVGNRYFWPHSDGSRQYDDFLTGDERHQSVVSSESEESGGFLGQRIRNYPSTSAAVPATRPGCRKMLVRQRPPGFERWLTVPPILGARGVVVR